MSRTDYLSECRVLYDQKLSANFGIPVGVPEPEMGLTFPASYRQFLLWMGNDKNGALKGSAWFVDDLIDNQKFLDEFLNENEVSGVFNGPKLCFFSHQGYMAAWFSVFAPEADPICQFYSEARTTSVASSTESLSRFIYKELSGVVEVLLQS